MQKAIMIIFISISTMSFVFNITAFINRYHSIYYDYGIAIFVGVLGFISGIIAICLRNSGDKLYVMLASLGVVINLITTIWIFYSGLGF